MEPLVCSWTSQEALGRRVKMASAVAAVRRNLKGGRDHDRSAPVEAPSSARRSRASRKKDSAKMSFPRTPGTTHKANKGKLTAFGSPIEALAVTKAPLLNSVESVSIPLVLHALCSRLGGDLESPEGLFRKAGSSVRQRALRQQLDDADAVVGVYEALLAEASPLDVAALLKQWLRALPDPLITPEVQEKLTQDYTDLSSSTPLSLVPCLLSTVLLSPPICLSSLVYLLRFLANFAADSASHKMDASNLSIVLAPTLFAVAQEDAVALGRLSAATHREAVIAKQTKLLEMLIDNADKIGYLPEILSEEYQLQLANADAFASQSEDNLDYDDADQWGGAPGPSERRRKKKKRRSGSISRVLSVTMSTVRGLHNKVMSRTNTPVAPHRKPSYYDYTFDHSVHGTPLPASQKKKNAAAASRQFTSPRLPIKRKVGAEHEMSPNSKQLRKQQQQNSTSSFDSFTPKVRSRSFSVKSKFKRKKSLKGGEMDLEGQTLTRMELSNISPLPSKPTLSLAMATPGTPTSSDFPSGYDMESPMPPQNRKAAGRSQSPSPEREVARVRRNSSSASNRRSRDRQSRKAHRSPSFRKLGEARRKSKENGARRKPSNVSVTDGGGGKTVITTHTHNVAPRPSRSSRRSHSGSSTKSTTVKGGKKHNESLVNLRQDLNTYIEQSFGGEQQKEKNDAAADLSITTRMQGISVNEVDGGSHKAEDGKSKFRRQSSAFEFTRSTYSLRPLAPEIRRQSSAFEIREQALYENFNRTNSVATRASLRRRNSSVKDLINRLENKPKAAQPEPAEDDFPPPLPVLPPPASRTLTRNVSSSGDLSAAEADDWVDAAEFFNAPSTVGPPIPRHLNVDLVAAGSSGCKRSSIIKIRQENRGLVSKSVETFTRPMTPAGTPSAIARKVARHAAAMPPPQPSRKMTVAAAAAASPAFNACHSRRLSARMGVASLTPMAPSPLNRTGIRTTTNYKKKTATTPKAGASNIPVAIRKTPKAESPMVLPERKSTDRRAKRAEGRRHLTVIGYEGEVRSPLRERQNNIVVTVQRSKSAQTPMSKKPTLKKPPTPQPDLHNMVTRSSSLKQHVPQAHHQSKRVRRHGSVSVVDSPARCRTPAAVPAIKPALGGTPRTLDTGRLARGMEARLGRHY